MMSPEQCRAARAWLSWSQKELAQRAHVGLSTVKDFERGDRKPMVNNLEAMRRAIEEAGIRLVFDEGGTAPVGIAVSRASS
jgi:DNA-binding transcriptional regulator YiaG